MGHVHSRWVASPPLTALCVCVAQLVVVFESVFVPSQGVIPSSDDPDVQPRPWLLDLKAEQIQSWTDEDWDERLRGSALRRIKPWMWRRNAAAARPDNPPSVG